MVNRPGQQIVSHPDLTGPVAAPTPAAKKPPALRESADTITKEGWQFNPKQNIIEYLGHTIYTPQSPKIPHLELLIRLIKGEAIASADDLHACIDLIVELRAQELNERVIRTSDEFTKALSIFPDFIVDIYERNKKSRRGSKAHAELNALLEKERKPESWLINNAVAAFLHAASIRPRVHIVRRPSGHQPQWKYPHAAPSAPEA